MPIIKLNSIPFYTYRGQCTPVFTGRIVGYFCNELLILYYALKKELYYDTSHPKAKIVTVVVSLFSIAVPKMPLNNFKWKTRQDFKKQPTFKRYQQYALIPSDCVTWYQPLTAS